MATIEPETVISLVSLTVTLYFWFVQSRRERPDLRVHQLRDFRAHARRVPDNDNIRRLGIQQIGSNGVLIANNSTRQNSIVRFECSFRYFGRTIYGDWGYLDETPLPWNIPPESSIAIGIACYFDVPEDFDVPENLEFDVWFIAVSGQRFHHRFSTRTPRMETIVQSEHRAA